MMSKSRAKLITQTSQNGSGVLFTAVLDFTSGMTAPRTQIMTCSCRSRRGIKEMTSMRQHKLCLQGTWRRRFLKKSNYNGKLQERPLRISILKKLEKFLSKSSEGSLISGDIQFHKKFLTKFLQSLISMVMVRFHTKIFSCRLEWICFLQRHFILDLIKNKAANKIAVSKMNAGNQQKTIKTFVRFIKKCIKTTRLNFSQKFSKNQAKNGPNLSKNSKIILMLMMSLKSIMKISSKFF